MVVGAAVLVVAAVVAGSLGGVAGVVGAAVEVGASVVGDTETVVDEVSEVSAWLLPVGAVDDGMSPHAAMATRAARLAHIAAVGFMLRPYASQRASDRQTTAEHGGVAGADDR